MKLQIILIAFLINYCTCVKLPVGDFKDALEHERNKPAVDRIRRMMKSNDDETIGIERESHFLLINFLIIKSRFLAQVYAGLNASLGQFPYQAMLYLDLTGTSGNKFDNFL